nr:carboxypeptidase-like regulatory domain-containing protein [Mucilaginibacter rivuli]
MLPKDRQPGLSKPLIAGDALPDVAENLVANRASHSYTRSSRRQHIVTQRVDEPTGSADVVAVVEAPVDASKADITSIAVTQFQKEKVEGKIAGTVTDATGHAIPGARIIVKGSNTKVLANSNGEFFLPIEANKDSVTVQMMGYDTKKLLVNGTGKLEVKLDEAASTLTEVEVTHKMRPPDIHDAQPQLGWKAYKAYLNDKAVLPTGETGKVKLKFLVDTQGRISNIRVIRGRSDTMNRKAIALVVNGPEWYGDSESKLKEIKLKIKFHKTTTDL